MEGKEKERERNINVWLPLTSPLLGTWPATQACALTRNQTGNPLVHRPTLSPLSCTARAHCLFCSYHFILLHPCTFSVIPLPSGNPPNDLSIYNFVSILLVCLICFLDSVVGSCEFISILLFIVLIIFFFLNKSL